MLVKNQLLLTKYILVRSVMRCIFIKGLDTCSSRQVNNLTKTTKLLSLKEMFRQKLLSSSVN